MKIAQKYFFLLLFPIILVLPLPLIFGSIGLALALGNLLAITLIENSTSSYKIAPLKEQVFILFGLFIVNLDWIVSSLRTGEAGFFISEQRISFLIVPLVFYFGRNHLYKIKSCVFGSLVVGVILYLLYVYGFLVYFYSFETNRTFQFSHYLKYDITTYMPGSYHHTYLGMYMTFAIAIILEKFEYKPISLWFVGFLTLNQLVMGSKLTFFLSLLLVFYGITRLSSVQPRRVWVKISALIFTVLVISYSFLKGLFDTFDFSLGNRLNSWSCSLQILSDNKWLGVSKENALNFLGTCINNKAISTHNQILSELVCYGIFGLWIIGYFIFLLGRSKGDFIFKVLVALVIFLCFFENVFSLQRGILFFTFFASLLIYVNPLDNEKDMSSDLGA